MCLSSQMKATIVPSGKSKGIIPNGHKIARIMQALVSFPEACRMFQNKNDSHKNYFRIQT